MITLATSTTLTAYDVARMIDLSAVRADSDETEVRALVALAKQHQCICVFALPAFTPLVVELLQDAPDVHTGGVVGFPAGGDTTASKVFQTRELIAMGCREIDMVINIGRLRSGQLAAVEDDIRAVVQAAGIIPVKVILECHYLDEAQIRAACAIALRCGVAFVKTGTGWAASGATVDNISLMRSCVCQICESPNTGFCTRDARAWKSGCASGVKAAGGVRDLATLVELYRRGANRFGIGLRSAEGIFRELDALPGGAIAVEAAQSSDNVLMRNAQPRVY